jgi:hypothetical protein
MICENQLVRIVPKNQGSKFCKVTNFENCLIRFFLKNSENQGGSQNLKKKTK